MKINEQIAYHEKRLEMLKAKAQPTWRSVRAGARGLQRALDSLYDEEGDVRPGCEELADMIAGSLEALQAYYSVRGLRLLDREEPAEGPDEAEQRR